MAEPSPTDRLDVGHVGKAHGLRGEVNIRLTTDRSERVDPGQVLHADGRALTVEASRPHQKGWIVAFEGVTTREQAEAIRGATLSATPIEDPDVIWVHELIGASIEEIDGTPRGVVESVQENPASDLLVTDAGALVPLTFFVEQRGSTVVVDTPPGLFELVEARWGSPGQVMTMRIDVFSIFPELVDDFTSGSLVGKARQKGLVDLRMHDLRDATDDVHRTVDDSPFGGGAGMVLKPGPIFDSVEAAAPPRPLLLLSPSGRTFDQAYAHELAAGEGFSLLCGRYEGVDQRVRDHLIDGEVSIGDYVLSGGEVAAIAIIEAVGRLVPGVMGNATSADDESFADGLLEYPHYTRPWEYRGWSAPEVLRSGDHARVARWRQACALRSTIERRPDLIERRGGLTDADQALLAEFDGVE